MTFYKRLGLPLAVALLAAGIVIIFAFGALTRQAIMENEPTTLTQQAPGGQAIIPDEIIPQSMPPASGGRTFAVSTVLVALSGLALAVATVLAMVKNPAMVPYKVMSVLIGASLVVMCFLTNSFAGGLVLINNSTLPLTALLAAQLIMVLVSARKPEESTVQIDLR